MDTKRLSGAALNKSRIARCVGYWGLVWLVVVGLVGCLDTEKALLRALGDEMGREEGEEGGEGEVSFCEGFGPPEFVGEVCFAQFTRRVFARALCACDGVTVNAGLHVERLGDADASLGSNRTISVQGLLRVDGDLRSGHVDGLSHNEDLVVARNLYTHGPLNVSANVEVGGDAFVAGDILVTRDFRVMGDLYQPLGETIQIGGAQAHAEPIREAFSTTEPCACGEPAPDIVALIASHRTENDNEEAELSGVLVGLERFERDREIVLPCGRFYSSSVQGSGALDIRVTGRVLWFIAGDLRLEAPLEVVLAPGASLDLFVGGTITSRERVHLGSREQRGALRIYSAATTSQSLSGEVEIYGGFYAPEADLVLNQNTTIEGSLWVRRLTQGGPMVLRYDSALVSAAMCAP